MRKNENEKCRPYGEMGGGEVPKKTEESSPEQSFLVLFP